MREGQSASLPRLEPRLVNHSCDAIHLYKVLNILLLIESFLRQLELLMTVKMPATLALRLATACKAATEGPEARNHREKAVVGSELFSLLHFGPE